MNTKITLFAFLMLVPAIFAPPPVFSCGNYNATLQSVTPVNGDYNWTYLVCQSAPPAISHWVLETCICTESSDPSTCRGVILDYGSSVPDWNRHIEYGTDPTTGITGLKFDELPEFRGCETFWFVVGTNYNPISTIGGIKAGSTGKCNYTVTGPAHQPPSAPEFPSIAVPFIVAAGAATFVYTLRRMS